MFASPLRCAKM